MKDLILKLKNLSDTDNKEDLFKQILDKFDSYNFPNEEFKKVAFNDFLVTLDILFVEFDNPTKRKYNIKMLQKMDLLSNL